MGTVLARRGSRLFGGPHGHHGLRILVLVVLVVVVAVGHRRARPALPGPPGRAGARSPARLLTRQGSWRGRTRRRGAEAEPSTRSPIRYRHPTVGLRAGPANTIRATDLTKRFGEKVAVDGLSFEVDPDRSPASSVPTAPASRRRCG